MQRGPLQRHLSKDRQWSLWHDSFLYVLPSFIIPDSDLFVMSPQLQTEPQYNGTFRFGQGVHESGKFRDFILHLPRVLWELGGTNLPTTEVNNQITPDVTERTELTVLFQIILLFLLRLFQRKTWLTDSDVRKLK
jgi:hypothetical protein